MPIDHTSVTLTGGQFHWEDPLLIEAQLSDEERMIRDTARQYAQEKLAPRIRDWNRMDALYELQTPVLLLHGEHDYIVPELATMARDRLANGELAFFKGCSHMPFFEDPEGYIRAVSTFLNP